MRNERTQSSFLAIERQISRSVHRAHDQRDLEDVDPTVLVHLGYEVRACELLRSSDTMDPYARYTLSRLDSSLLFLEIYELDRAVLEMIRDTELKDMHPNAFINAVSISCTPTIIAQAITTLAAQDIPIARLSDCIGAVRTLAEHVRIARVHRASCDAFVGLGLLEMRLGNNELAFQHLYDAAAHALRSPPLLSLTRAALLEAVARISPDVRPDVTDAWVKAQLEVRRDLPRMVTVLRPPVFSLAERQLQEDCTDEQLLNYIEAMRGGAAAPLFAIAYDALLSHDELSVSTTSKEVRAVAEEMTSKRDSMLEMIADLDVVLTELAKEKMRISKLTEERRSLLDLAAHEIKNPLLSISLLASRMKTLDDTPELETVRREILRQIDKLEEEIHRYLVDSVDRQEEMFVSDQPCDLSVIIEDEWHTCAVQARERRLTFGLEVEKGIQAFLSDVAARIVVRNLFSNAVRHSPINGRVSISLQTRDEWAVLQVANSVGDFTDAPDPYSTGYGKKLLEMVAATVNAHWDVLQGDDQYIATVKFPIVSPLAAEGYA